jgi:hypothetical protein
MFGTILVFMNQFLKNWVLPGRPLVSCSPLRHFIEQHGATSTTMIELARAPDRAAPCLGPFHPLLREAIWSPQPLTTHAPRTQKQTKSNIGKQQARKRTMDTRTSSCFMAPPPSVGNSSARAPYHHRARMTQGHMREQA